VTQWGYASTADDEGQGLGPGFMVLAGRWTGADYREGIWQWSTAALHKPLQSAANQMHHPPSSSRHAPVTIASLIRHPTDLATSAGTGLGAVGRRTRPPPTRCRRCGAHRAELEWNRGRAV